MSVLPGLKGRWDRLLKQKIKESMDSSENYRKHTYSVQEIPWVENRWNPEKYLDEGLYRLAPFLWFVMHPSSRACSQVGSCSHLLKTFLSLWSYLRTSRDKTSINWDYKVSQSLSKQEVRTENLMNKMMWNVSPSIFRHCKKHRRAVISPAIFSMPLGRSVFIPNSLLLNISNCDIIQEYYIM